jgi:hypothetical protein
MKFPILPPSLTELQKEVLIGSLLGDTYMQIKKGSINPRIEIGRAIKDLDYLTWQYNLFKDFCSDKGIEIRYLAHPELCKYNNNHDPYKKYGQCRFRTRNVPAFKEIYDSFYSNKVKIVPKNLSLTDQIVAIWFCDDGCLNKNNLSISTDGFYKEDVDFLIDLLRSKYDGNFYKIKRESFSEKENFEIRTSYTNGIKMIEKIKPFIPISMNRKLKNLKLL